jgi:hypothetical protein
VKNHAQLNLSIPNYIFLGRIGWTNTEKKKETEVGNEGKEGCSWQGMGENKSHSWDCHGGKLELCWWRALTKRAKVVVESPGLDRWWAFGIVELKMTVFRQLKFSHLSCKPYSRATLSSCMLRYLTNFLCTLNYPCFGLEILWCTAKSKSLRESV